MSEVEKKIDKIKNSILEIKNSLDLEKIIIELKKLLEKYPSHFTINEILAKMYINLGNLKWKKLELEEAIKNYKLSLDIKPDNFEAINNLKKAKKEKIDLVTFLTYKNPSTISSNPIISSHQKLKEIDIRIDFKKKISNHFLKYLFAQIQNIVEYEKIDTDLDVSQIHRESKIKYNKCVRHFDVFNTFNVIPKNCFDCYKIQILPRTIIELIKLYLVFDNINTKIGLTRKCMIEFREGIKEPYKGFIYCIGIEEANKTLKTISPLLDKTISFEMPRLIKRGCSEFAMSYPNYKEIDSTKKNFMYYNPNWDIKEKIIDHKLSNLKKEELIEDETLNGISIKDAIIINNWLYYAKKIGDKTYRLICKNPYFSKYIEEKLTKDVINNLKLN